MIDYKKKYLKYKSKYLQAKANMIGGMIGGGAVWNRYTRSWESTGEGTYSSIEARFFNFLDTLYRDERVSEFYKEKYGENVSEAYEKKYGTKAWVFPRDFPSMLPGNSKKAIPSGTKEQPIRKMISLLRDKGEWKQILKIMAYLFIISYLRINDCEGDDPGHLININVYKSILTTTIRLYSHLIPSPIDGKDRYYETLYKNVIMTSNLPFYKTNHPDYSTYNDGQNEFEKDFNEWKNNNRSTGAEIRPLRELTKLVLGKYYTIPVFSQCPIVSQNATAQASRHSPSKGRAYIRGVAQGHQSATNRKGRGRGAAIT